MQNIVSSLRLYSLVEKAKMKNNLLAITVMQNLRTS